MYQWNPDDGEIARVPAYSPAKYVLGIIGCGSVDRWVQWVQAAAPLPNPLSPAHRDSRGVLILDWDPNTMDARRIEASLSTGGRW